MNVNALAYLANYWGSLLREDLALLEVGETIVGIYPVGRWKSNAWNERSCQSGGVRLSNRPILTRNDLALFSGAQDSLGDVS